MNLVIAPDPLLGLLLRLLHQRWTLAVHLALDEAGFSDLRPSHANVFTFVPPAGIQVSQLTVLGQVRKQTMTQAVEELEVLGYVERRPDPHDRRARLVFLTPRGQLVQPVALAASRQVEAAWAEYSSPAQIEALRSGLQTLLAQLQQADDAADPAKKPSSTPRS
jgi:DNA-binding MarR family transcriptional regulator